jgi:Protein of unknown function (DUF1156)
MWRFKKGCLLVGDTFWRNATSRDTSSKMIENDFNVSFVADLALREKQIQQNYRPVIAVHKWFARRPGTLFRALLLAEFCADGELREGEQGEASSPREAASSGAAFLSFGPPLAHVAPWARTSARLVQLGTSRTERLLSGGRAVPKSTCFSANGASRNRSKGWNLLTTPSDYLEKIFQK